MEGLYLPCNYAFEIFKQIVESSESNQIKNKGQWDSKMKNAPATSEKVDKGMMTFFSLSCIF